MNLEYFHSVQKIFGLPYSSCSPTHTDYSLQYPIYRNLLVKPQTLKSKPSIPKALVPWFPNPYRSLKLHISFNFAITKEKTTVPSFFLPRLIPGLNPIFASIWKPFDSLDTGLASASSLNYSICEKITAKKLHYSIKLQYARKLQYRRSASRTFFGFAILRCSSSAAKRLISIWRWRFWA